MEPNEKITLKASTCLFSSEKQRNRLCFSGNEFALVANSCLCFSVSINGALAFIPVNSKFYNGSKEKDWKREYIARRIWYLNIGHK